MDRILNGSDEKQALYKIYRACRLCGADGGYKMPIIQNVVQLDEDGIELRQKIKECVQIEVNDTDRMPPLICELCVDKVIDFYQFLDMCKQNDRRTRQRLGLPLPPLQTPTRDSTETIPPPVAVSGPVPVSRDNSSPRLSVPAVSRARPTTRAQTRRATRQSHSEPVLTPAVQDGCGGVLRVAAPADLFCHVLSDSSLDADTMNVQDGCGGVLRPAAPAPRASSPEDLFCHVLSDSSLDADTLNAQDGCGGVLRPAAPAPRASSPEDLFCHVLSDSSLDADTLNVQDGCGGVLRPAAPAPRATSPEDLFCHVLSDSSLDADTLNPSEVNARFEAASTATTTTATTTAATAAATATSLLALKRRRIAATDVSLSQVKRARGRPRKLK